MKRYIVLALVILGLAVAYQPSVNAATDTYAALGDSVAAGAGLPSNNATCKRSSQAYPYEVAQATGLTLQHLACSGAKVDEGLYDEQEVGSTTTPAQLDDAFSAGTPKLITLTIGANDVRWTQFIRQCYYTTCGKGTDTAFAVLLADLKLELNVAMAKISTLSKGTPPHVILTGYYNTFSSTTCTDSEGITASDRSWLKRRTSSLNSAISGVASKYSYVHYAAVDFADHGLCSSDPWIQGLSDPMPFHPTAAGQAEIARKITAKYNRVATAEPSSTPKSYRERALNWYNRYRQ